MREIKERFMCDRCGRSFTESDEEEAELCGYSTDPAHWLCPSCYMEEKQKKQNMSSHWRKPDHIAFLLMLPFILAVLILCLVGDLFWIEVSGCVLLFLWLYAFSYDLEEEKEAK
jgi:rubredoxin